MNSIIDKYKNELEKSGLYNFDIKKEDVITLYNQYQSSVLCNKCKGLDNCPQYNKGYYECIISDNPLTIGNKKCKYLLLNDEKENKNKKINLMYVPKRILEANMDDFELDSKNRNDAFNYANKFITSYLNGKTIKSMYLSGSNGAGKTYLLGAIANELAKNNVKSILVYVPDLARNLKSTMFDGTLEEKINVLKDIDVLMLDDIGVEVITPWFRDEILGSILNYRIQDGKPTFFSSNISLKNLAERLKENKENSSFDAINALRIYSRIEKNVKEFEI